ncbi:MAG TPA: peptide chain release factor N(5)-glutamine methyltransferase [Thermomicrobiales bacterium]|nr:peptide chain release factor N(5)-glutamine methyltransferase [Thermomicrobiales bacterium]
MTTTTNEALKTAANRLAAAGIATARLDAEVLLRHVLRIDRTQLFVRLSDPLAEEAQHRFDELIAARLAGQPVAYLTGEREFMGMSFAVGPGVLIPRPETEWLVEWAITRMEAISGGAMVDVGTGSGAIALSVAKLLGPDGWAADIVGIDSSIGALAYAAVNRVRLGLSSVSLIRGDLIQALRGPVDVIVANLPYLRPDQVAGNPDLAAEPVRALIGGADGLDLVRELLADAPRILSPRGAIGLELDPANVAEAAEVAQRNFPRADVRISADLAGYDRYVVIIDR